MYNHHIYIVKKLLLICPHFMGYDQILKAKLELIYNVDYINGDETLEKARKIYKNNSKILRAIYKIFKFAKQRYRENILVRNNCESQYNILSKKYHVILVINGDCYTDSFYRQLVEKNNEAKKCLFIWDDISWLYKTSHIKYFDKVYSYNIDDCRRRKFSYIPVFTQRKEIPKHEKIYDISIIASATDERVKLAKKIYSIYKDKYIFYIYFYDKDNKYDFFSHNIPLKNMEYMEVLSKSKVVFDNNRFNQRGPSTRIHDCLFTKTKIITTNKNIRKYPLSQDNILVINAKCEIPQTFIDKSFVESIYEGFSIEQWIDTVIKSY